MSLSERDSLAVWHPYTQFASDGPPITIKEAKGSILYGADDKEYVDAVSSWWVNLHGHACPEIVSAIHETIRKLGQVIFAGFTHEPAVKLAENLLNITRLEKGRVFFSDDGSTSVEAALKMAVQYWHNIGINKKTIIALEGAYHGDTFGSMSVSERGVFNKPFNQYLFNAEYLNISKSKEECVEDLNSILKNQDAAAFIFEPLIQGAAGMKIHSAECLESLIALCREKNVLTIADEVFTGFYRTGRMFASDYLKHKPDIYCFSKGITGGVLPLGATVAAEKIFKAFLADDRQKMFLHGHSYTANPVSCAAANASIEILFKPETQNRIALIEKNHAEFLEALANHPNALNPRMLGTILALEVKSDDAGGYLNSMRDRLYKFYLENGVLLRPLGNTVYIVPPYCIKREELERVYGIIFRSLDEFPE